MNLVYRPHRLFSWLLLAASVLETAATSQAQDEDPDKPKYFVSPRYGNRYQHINETQVLTRITNPKDGMIQKRRTAGGFRAPNNELVTTSEVPMISGYDKVFNNTIAGFPVRVSERGDVLLYVGKTDSRFIPQSSGGALWRADDSVVKFGPSQGSDFLVPRDMNEELTMIGEMLYPYENQFKQDRRRAVAVMISPSGKVSEIAPARFSEYGYKLKPDPDGGRPDVIMDNQATAMAINSSGEIACDARGSFTHQATQRIITEKFSFISKNGSITKSDLPEGAMDINDRGEVVGYNNASRTWLYLPKANYGLGAGTHTIDPVEYEPDDYPMRARINDRGDIVWTSTYTAVSALPQRTPALWREGTTYPLASLYDSGEKFRIRQIRDLNDKGDILVETEFDCELNGQTFTCLGNRILSLSPFAQKLVVNSDSDESDADPDDKVIDTDLEKSGNQVTLRAAIEAVNAGSDLPIEFNIEVEGGGIPPLAIVKPLPPVTRPVIIDGTTQAGGFVEIRGNKVNAPGIHLMGGKSEVRGMIIHSVQGKGAAAIKISGPGENKILGCRFGTDASGNTVLETSVGVQIDGSPKNQIGGDKDGEANIIHAKDIAVKIEGEGADENTIWGNRIGIGVNGKILKPLAGGGVYIERGNRNVVGGDGTQGNRIACATSVSGGGVHKITGLDIIGNRIGLDAAGVNAGGGSDGIALFGAKEKELTGVKIAKNKVAGNVFNILAFGGNGGLSDVAIEDNEIGLRFDGSGKLPSGVSESHLYGIRLDVVSKASLKRNIVAGHTWNILVAGNIQLFAEGEDTDGDGEDDSWSIIALTPENPGGDDDDDFKGQDVKIEGNTVGLNRADKVPDGAEQTAGVATFGLAGRTTIRNNTIAGHKGNQVWLQNGAGHVVSGNTIGTPDGTDVGSQVGVFIQNTERATIALANVISGNKVTGILITGKADSTVIRGNRIGTSRSGNEAWPNKVGIAILEVEGNDGELDTPLGIAIEGNTISGNTGEGVSIDLSGLVDMKGNRIGVGLDGGPLPNAVGVSFEDGNGTLMENTIAHNRLSGVAILKDSSKVRILSSSIYANGGGLGDAGIAYDDAPINPPSKVVGLRSAPDAFGIVRLTFAISAQDEDDEGSAAILEIFGNPKDSERQGQEFLFRKLIDPAEPLITTIEVPANSPMAAVKNFTATLTMDSRTSAFSKHAMAEAIVWPEIDIAESDAPGRITLSWPDSPNFRLETFSSAIPHWRESDAIIIKVGGLQKATVTVHEEFEFEMFRLAIDEEALLSK